MSGAEPGAGPDFWAWFATVAERLAVDYEDGSLWSEVGHRLALEQPGLTFDFGVDGRQDWWFSISPDGRPEQAARAATFVDAAPPVPPWTVRLGRQARSWEDTVALAVATFPDVAWKEMDPEYWRVQVDDHDPKALALRICAMDRSGRPIGEQLGRFLLMSRMGEMNFLRQVQQVVVITDPPDDSLPLTRWPEVA